VTPRPIKLAKCVKVTRGGYLEIDGEVFPWATSVDGFTVNIRRDELPGVTFTLVAERVVADDDMNEPARRNEPSS
jgi:hypothetical protein